MAKRILKSVAYAAILLLGHIFFAAVGLFVTIVIAFSDSIPAAVKIICMIAFSLLFCAIIVYLALKRVNIITAVYLSILALSSLLAAFDIGSIIAIAPLSMIWVFGGVASYILPFIFYAVMAGISIWRLVKKYKSDAARTSDGNVT